MADHVSTGESPRRPVSQQRAEPQGGGPLASHSRLGECNAVKGVCTRWPASAKQVMVRAKVKNCKAQSWENAGADQVQLRHVTLLTRPAPPHQWRHGAPADPFQHRADQTARVPSTRLPLPSRRLAPRP